MYVPTVVVTVMYCYYISIIPIWITALVVGLVQISESGFEISNKIRIERTDRSLSGEGDLSFCLDLSFCRDALGCD